MKLPNIEIDENFIIEIAKKYNIRELSLFGSVLRNDFSINSDIDMLIEFNKNTNYSYFDLQEIEEKLSAILKRPVDLVEKESITNPFKRKVILNSTRKIYESN
jgi:predicted nucleotidyltransferase